MIPGIVAGGQFLPPSVIVVGGGSSPIESSGTTVSPTFHASTQAGDTVFAFVTARSAVTTPDGWTLVIKQDDLAGGTAQPLSIYKRVYEIGDGASVVFTQASSGRISGHCVSVRPRNASSISVLSHTGAGLSAHTVQEVQGTADGQIVLAGSSCTLAEISGNTTYTAATGWTQTTTVSAAQNRLMVAYIDAPTDSPVSGSHSHSAASHDSAEVSLLIAAS